MSTSPARRAAGWRRLFAAAAAAFCLAAPLAAKAQSYDVQSLNDRLNMLQRDISDLQRQVYSNGGNAGAAGGDSVAQLGGGGAAANQEVRLQQLDDQMRNLTGQVEQLSYKLQQVSTRLDKLVGDVDFRLRQLEQGQGGAAGAPAPLGPPAAGNAPDQMQQQDTTVIGGGADAGQPPPGQQTMSPPPQVLGTLNQSQLNANRVTLPTEPAPAAPAAAGGGGSAEEQYNNALELLRQANYPQAEQAFRSFVRAHPGDRLAGNAQYWLGETYYVRGNYTDAAVAFAEGYQKYPTNAKAADNLLKLGMSLSALGRKGDACKAYDQLARQFPNAPANVKTRAARERQNTGCPA